MHVNAIRSALPRQPFQPFSLRLIDGREFPVPHRDFVALSRRTVVVMDTQSEGFTILEPALIASIKGLRDEQAAGSPQPPG